MYEVVEGVKMTGVGGSVAAHVLRNGSKHRADETRVECHTSRAQWVQDDSIGCETAGEYEGAAGMKI